MRDEIGKAYHIKVDPGAQNWRAFSMMGVFLWCFRFILETWWLLRFTYLEIALVRFFFNL